MIGLADTTAPRELPGPETVDGPGGKANPPVTLRSLFRDNRTRILASYALFTLENLLRLAQPLMLGLAINDLMVQSSRGLVLLAIQHACYMSVGFVRQAYDTRVYVGIYKDLASGMVVGQHAKGIDTSRIAARSAMSRAYIDFFEQHVPTIIRSLWSVFGAIAMLCFYDPGLLPWCVAVIVPAVLLNAAYGRRTFLLNGRMHDEMEKEVEVIRAANRDEVRRHYSVIGRCQIRLSDAEAINFLLMELFILALIVAVLMQFCATEGVQAGDVFAVFRYIMLFVMGLDAVPRLVCQFSRLRDIGTRI